MNEEERLKLFLNTMTHSMFKEYKKNVVTTETTTSITIEESIGKSKMKQGSEEDLVEAEPLKLTPKPKQQISISTKDLLKWRSDDERARGELIKWVNTSSIRGEIEECNTAFELWSMLKKMFDKKSPAIKVQLKVEFYEMSMGEKENLISFLNRLVAHNVKMQHHGVSVGEEELCYKLLSALTKSHQSLQQHLMMLPDD